MHKLKLETPNIVEKNIELIGQIFPSCMTEIKGSDGKIKRGINFEALKQMLSPSVIDGDESYGFTWVGKKASVVEANKPIRRTLRPHPEESVSWDTTENLYIEGDNLEVLKLLQEAYLGKVKFIYIDPPYNTGNDFIYADDFMHSQNDENTQLGVFDDEGNRLFKNTDTNGRFHSDWCSMIYSRLLLARNLLSDDGVIFVSIDDCEQENLKKILNDVFNESNYIATIVRNTNSSKNQSLFISVSHEYCIVFAKNIEILKSKHAENKWNVPKNNLAEYIAKVKQLEKEGLSPEEITEELKTLTKYPRFVDFTNYWYFDERGLYSKGDLGGVPNGNKTPIWNPVTGKYDPIPPGGFRFSEEKLNQFSKEGRIHFHTDGSLPRIKRYLNENMTQRPKSIMSDDQRPDSSMMQEFNTPFDNPKQLAFIKRIVSIADKDSIVLDFFSGSSTTAHAVMQLNAEDGGHRKFIMIQLPEACNEKSDAYKAGYNNICEIGKERIRRAGEKIKEENPLNTFNLDTGFRVLKLDDSNMKDVYYAAQDLSQTVLLDAISNVKEDRSDLDLLFGCLLDWGVPLSLPYTSEQIDGFTVHTYNEGDLIACFDINISENVVKEIAKRKPLRAVFRDSCFSSSPSKINVFEIFKLYMPEDADNISRRVKVI